MAEKGIQPNIPPLREVYPLRYAYIPITGLCTCVSGKFSIPTLAELRAAKAARRAARAKKKEKDPPCPPPFRRRVRNPPHYTQPVYDIINMKWFGDFYALRTCSILQPLTP
eukprot:1391889-Amorphochlora_amoeboformis.AAC.3